MLFSAADSNTAYVLNCGPECGSSESGLGCLVRHSVADHHGYGAGGRRQRRLLNGTTLYVAGSPVPPGTTSTYDAVNVSNMTRITANSVAIGDGFHTTMALSTNNKLYIGANYLQQHHDRLLVGGGRRHQYRRSAASAARCDHQPDVGGEPQCDVCD